MLQAMLFKSFNRERYRMLEWTLKWNQNLVVHFAVTISYFTIVKIKSFNKLKLKMKNSIHCLVFKHFHDVIQMWRNWRFVVWSPTTIQIHLMIVILRWNDVCLVWRQIKCEAVVRIVRFSFARNLTCQRPEKLKSILF